MKRRREFEEDEEWMGELNESNYGSGGATHTLNGANILRTPIVQYYLEINANSGDVRLSVGIVGEAQEETTERGETR